jgi:energy-coupling factor transporter ATP-binding protein EcfA2
MTAALRFDRYGFTYSGAAKASLADVTLELGSGQVVSVIAGQGLGKTTLLRAAAGLLGEIYDGSVQGILTRDSTLRPGAFFDGYVQVTLAVETVGEEIGLPLYAAGMTHVDRARRVESVARELRIEHLLDRDVTALSGGEEKLVGIAAAFVAESPVHVLDEPFEQLDVAHLAAVIRAAKRRARAGRLVLISTGSVDTALNVCDSAVVFDGAVWRAIDRPTYEDVGAVAGLSNSSLGIFLRMHSAESSSVRRFRDGVQRIS